MSTPIYERGYKPRPDEFRGIDAVRSYVLQSWFERINRNHNPDGTLTELQVCEIVSNLGKRVKP